MGSSFGKRVKIQIFGESHGPAIGGVIDGLPAGELISMDALSVFMERRRPGKTKTSTSRREADEIKILSGLKNFTTTGEPVAILIENRDASPSDYDNINLTARPGHVDYPLYVQTEGHAILEGGGHYSGRLTAPICALGGMALQILEKRGIAIGAHILKIGTIEDEAFDGIDLTSEELLTVKNKKFPVLNDHRGKLMTDEILKAKSEKDSVGGVVECAVYRLPVGIGWGIFDKVESRLSQGIFSIGGVKAVEFGDGFEAANLLGSEHNDEFIISDGKVKLKTNHAGGLLGGKTTGMPLIFKVGFKPTPTIGKRQDYLDLERMQVVTKSHGGRHDPCIVPRAVPVVEAMTAIVLLDMILEGCHEF